VNLHDWNWFCILAVFPSIITHPPCRV
jgi:hypothetical protein